MFIYLRENKQKSVRENEARVLSTFAQWQSRRAQLGSSGTDTDASRVTAVATIIADLVYFVQSAPSLAAVLAVLRSKAERAKDRGEGALL